MHYRLYGLGRKLRRPVVDIAEGDLDDALRLAEKILKRERHCETIEIFSGAHFLTAIDRYVSVPVRRSAWSGPVGI